MAGPSEEVATELALRQVHGLLFALPVRRDSETLEFIAACQKGNGGSGLPAIMVSNAPSASLEKLPHAPQVTVPSSLAAAAFLLGKKECYNPSKHGGGRT
jgi:hypothetical protein